MSSVIWSDEVGKIKVSSEFTGRTYEEEESIGEVVDEEEGNKDDQEQTLLMIFSTYCRPHCCE